MALAGSLAGDQDSVHRRGRRCAHELVRAVVPRQERTTALAGAVNSARAPPANPEVDQPVRTGQRASGSL